MFGWKKKKEEKVEEVVEKKVEKNSDINDDLMFAKMMEDKREPLDDALLFMIAGGQNMSVQDKDAIKKAIGDAKN